MKYLVLFLIAILTLPVAFAADFSVSLSPTSASVCPSESTSYKLNIKNEANERAIFAISVPENLTNWTRILPNNFGLEGGESTTVAVFVQPHFTAKPETIDFSITTQSGSDVTPLKAKLTVLSCRGVEVTTTPVNTCDASQASAKIKIKNTGRINDTFKITTNQNWTSAENETVSVAANDSYEMNLKFGDVPIGSNSVKVNVESISSYSKASIELPVTIEKCFDVSVTSSESNAICPGENANINLRIKNIGTKADSYNIYTNDVIVKLNNTTATLGSGESKDLDITINIPRSANLNQTFTVYVDGTAKSSHKQNIEVVPYESCYSLTTAVEKRDVEVKQSENTFTSIAIKNNGRFPTSVNITSDTTWVDPSISIISIKPNESREIFIYVAPTYEVKDGRYDAIINISSGETIKTEKLSIYVNQKAPTEKVEIQNTNETKGPVISTEKLGKPFANILKFVFSPILSLFR